MIPFLASKRKRRASWIPLPSLTSVVSPDTICNGPPHDSMNNIRVSEPVIEDDGLSFCIAQTRRSARSLVAAVVGCLVLSWVLGAVGLSLAWLLLLITAAVARWNSQFGLLLAQTRWEEQQRVRKQRSFANSETAEWLNVLLNKWWLCSGDSIFHLVRERVEPILNESKPAFVERVELEQFTLGEQTPCIENIKSLHHKIGNPSQVLKNVSLRPNKHQVSLEIGVCLNSEDFRMVLRARLFGKGVGMDLDVAMEKLYLCGKLSVVVVVDVESPFPHVTNISVSFTEKPDLWFSIRILKSVQMMEVPIIKSWLHSVVIDAIETALVDPGQISFNPSGTQSDALTPEAENDNVLAQGVIIVTLSTTSDSVIDGEPKWLSLRLGSQNWKTSLITADWMDTPSFLTNSLEKDKLVIKMKGKRLVSSVTLAQYEINLDEYNLDTSQVVETFLQKRNPRTGQVPSIALRLEYSSLLMVNLDQPLYLTSVPNTRFGVLTVFVHCAEGLSSNDTYQCNPYCVLFSNRRKVKSTPYLINTITPQWEACFQLIVKDFTQAALSFVVCSWNPKKRSDDEMLGVAILNLSQEDFWLVNKYIPLSGSPNASLKVSAVFQAVPRLPGEAVDRNPTMDVSSDGARIKRNSSSWVHQAKSFLGRCDQEVQSGTDISNLLTSGMGLMEVTIIKARDLVPMDMNGFSDPYCELKVNSECKYKSSVKKKTLNPSWDENAIMGMPRPGQTFDVMVWDHDTFGMKDFLGNVVFSLDEIRQISTQGEPMWCSLQGVRSGELQLRIKIISEDISYDACSVKSSIGRGSAEPSPLPRRASMERSRVRLGVNVPPPTPPRTVSIPKHDVARDSPDPCMPIVTITDSPCTTRANSQASSHLTVESLPPSPTSDTDPTKASQEMSSFRTMRLKVSRSLRLRRFKSEVNVRGPNNNHSKEVKTPLNHAVSQPNIVKPQIIRPSELNLNGRPDTFTGVEGRVIQAQGLHVAHVAQLYCTIKLLGGTVQKDKQNLGKTLAKSHLQPAMPNPQFQLDFQISSPEAVPRQAALLFEIRSASKEVLALRRITLQDIFTGDLKEIHSWLALNNGATLELSIGHGHILKKKSKKLFRSWSVHRIGKI